MGDRDGEVCGRGHRSAVRRAGDHLVEGPLVGVPGGAEDPGREAELEGDHAVHGEYDHAMDGPILARVDLRVTVGSGGWSGRLCA